MQSDAFALALDTGHEVKLNFMDSHIYEKYPNKIMHMHLHDCKAGKPHLPLGAGEVDIKNKLSSLVGETCLIEVKTISGLIDSIKYIKEGFDR
jgi:sugar phosphate isomerase/epimerase